MPRPADAKVAALLDVVPKAERVGLTPQEWIQLSRSPATVEPLTAEEWRAAILSTVKVVD